GNTIGGTTAAARNIISGNTGSGIEVDGSGNFVQANFIGTDVTGTVGLGNGGGGVVVLGGSNNTIGGADTNTPGSPLAGAGNLVPGQAGTGILVAGSGNRIQGNYVGTDVTGTHALGNTFGIGIQFGATSNWIGTTGLSDSGDSNVISGNTQGGLYLAYVGTNQ